MIILLESYYISLSQNYMKKVVVTGGYGFIGSNLIRLLLKKNYFVINIDKISYSSNFYNLRNIETKNYVFIKTDINNKDASRQYNK